MENYLRHEAGLLFTKINIMSYHDMKIMICRKIELRLKLHIFFYHTLRVKIGLEIKLMVIHIQIQADNIVKRYI